MTTSSRLAALCLLTALPVSFAVAADTPVVIERAPEGDAAAAQAEAAALRQENERLKTQLASATVARTVSDTALKESTRELAKLRAKAAQLEKPADDLEAHLNAEKSRADEATASLAALQAENEKLKATPAPAPAAPDLSAKLAESEDKLAVTLRSFSQLQAENEKLKSAATSPERANELAAKLAESDGKLATALTSFSQLQTENERLKAATEAQTAELAQLHQAKSELESRLAAAQAAQAAAASAAPTPAPTAAPAADATTTRQLAETEDKLSTVLRSYSLLQRDVDQLKADAASAAEKAQTAAVRAASESAAQITALHDDLRQTQARADALAEENAQLKTRLAISGPPPGTTLATPLRPGTPQASAALQPPAPAPTEATPAAGPRTHTIVAGDNLAKIARKYYGNANRWDEILRANRDVIRNENVLPLGATLRIP